MIRTMAVFISLFGTIAYFGVQAQEQENAANLELQIAAKEMSFIQGQPSQLKATIINKGQAPVTLVLPGDGSESGWRTPVVGWSAIKADNENVTHPATPRLYVGGRCGNINALKRDEVFVLAPGQSRELNDWIGFPQLAEPGTYSVKLYYANDPSLKWRGLPLGKHDEDAMKQVQKSHKCSLVSNELRLLVKAKE